MTLVMMIVVATMPLFLCLKLDIKEFAAMPDGVVIDTINDYDESGMTPLLHAARAGYLDAVLNIIKAGANITKPSEYEGDSAVYLAAEGGHDIVVSALIRAGADVNHPNKLGITPIFAASQVGYTRTVKVLVEAGAGIGRISDNGLSPLMVAAIRGKPGVMEVLLEADPTGINMSTSTGETVLMSSVISRNAKCVAVALGAGAAVEAVDKKRRNALMYAASRNLADIAQILIDRGCDLDHKDKYGFSALDLAYVSNLFASLITLMDSSWPSSLSFEIMITYICVINI